MDRAEYLFEKVAIRLTDEKIIDLLANRVNKVLSKTNIKNDHMATRKVIEGSEEQLTRMRDMSLDTSNKYLRTNQAEELAKIKPDSRRVVQEARNHKLSLDSKENWYRIGKYLKRSEGVAGQAIDRSLNRTILERAREMRGAE